MNKEGYKILNVISLGIFVVFCCFIGKELRKIILC